ncbi:hypothetical protein ACVWW3_003442 [Bradyrhizobium sp. LM2.9]
MRVCAPGSEAAEIDEHHGDAAKVAACSGSRRHQPLHHLRRNVLAEQVRHPVARGGRGNARSKLTPELRTDRAREHAADQDDGAAHRMEIGLRLTDAAGAIVDQRHGEQLGCSDKASEGRKPKIQP